MDLDRVGDFARALMAGLGVVLALAGCGGTAPPGPARRATSTTLAPTATLPRLVVVQRDPDLAGWDPLLARCATAGPVLLAVEPPATPVASGWALQWDPPAPAGPVRAYGLGADGWVAVVHARNPVPRLTPAAWAALWTDPAATWVAATGVGTALPPPEPVTPRPDSPLGRALTAQVGATWTQHPRARLAPTPEQVVQQVAARPAALGLVAARWWQWAQEHRPDLPWTRVRVLTPPRIPPWEGAVVLRAPDAPAPAEARWITCLQRAAGARP